MAARNAYTYPAMTDMASATLANFIPVFGPLIFVMNAANWLSDHKDFLMSGKSDGTTITFPSNKLKIITFESKGLYSSIDSERQRMAIMLHEIGHWNYVGAAVDSTLFGQLKFIFPPLAFLFTVLSIIKAREVEYKSDQFAKYYGYGPDLADALKVISTNVRSDVSWYNKMGDFFIKIFTKIHNIVDTIIPATTHPSLTKRQAALMDGTNLSPQMLKHEELNLLEVYLLDEGFRDLILKGVTPLTRLVDKALSGKLNKLFPVKK